MRAPLSFVYGNCVFASSPEDVWAAFVVPCLSYEWLSADLKLAWLKRLAAALSGLEADLQIVRVARGMDLDRYVGEMSRLCGRPTRRAGGEADGTAPEDHLAADRRLDYLGEHRRRLAEIGAAQPVVFLLVSLREPQRDIAAYVAKAADRSPGEWLAALRASLHSRDRRLLGVEQLERAQVAAERVHQRLSGSLGARPARGVEIQWLVRRAFCRGLGEPVLDGLHEPRALAFEHNGKALLAPLEGDLVRWADGFVEHQARCLRVQSELGESWQALLVLGSLPDAVEFPGAGAELMFAPIESLPFAVDLSLNARLLPNGLAVRIARRGIQDADQVLQAESEGELGVSDAGEERSQRARELLAYLQSSSRPPLLRSTLTLALGARDEQQLAERVQMCRQAYGEIRLHRPTGEQLELFLQHLPAQRTRVAGYDDTLTVEQVAATMPLAAHAAGSSSGFYLGHSLSGSRRPLRLHLSEGSERSRNAAILSVGALGSGKTTLTQKLQYEAFLQGARVVDCDPKGDHRFHLLDDVAPHAQAIVLREDDRRLHGALDPLRVAPAHLRRDAGVSFLCDLLPARAEPAWETAILAAVDRVIGRSREPTCLEVVRALLAGDEVEAQVGRALQVHANAGLTQLGFADAVRKGASLASHQVSYIAIRDLPGPGQDTPRSEYTQAERVGVQIVRLIAMFAMSLLAEERERLKLFCFDEGWRLLGDPVGRMLLASLGRMGRSEMAVPIVSTQLVGDALVSEKESLANLLGATFVFGMRSDAEARRALELLGLDPDDRRARERLLRMDRGRCLFRDHLGRVESLQVELVAPWLSQALSTTPRPPWP